MANQCQLIIDYIKNFGSITTAEAMTDLGIYRLASRICDLKAAGYPIKSKMKTAKNRYGDTVHFKEYRLDNEEEIRGVQNG